MEIVKLLKLKKSMKPYGDDIEIKKEECVNDVAKRLKAGLENLKKKGGPGGISLGERGLLTDNTIGNLKSLYQMAIANSVGEVEKMERI